METLRQGSSKPREAPSSADLNGRREKRKERSRPWAETPTLNTGEDIWFIEYKDLYVYKTSNFAHVQFF